LCSLELMHFLQGTPEAIMSILKKETPTGMYPSAELFSVPCVSRDRTRAACLSLADILSTYSRHSSAGMPPSARLPTRNVTRAQGPAGGGGKL
jgi:hypothetical protein